MTTAILSFSFSFYVHSVPAGGVFLTFQAILVARKDMEKDFSVLLVVPTPPPNKKNKYMF